MQKKVLYSLGAKFSGNKYRIFTINKNSGIVADKNTKSIQWTVQNGQWQKKVQEKFLRLDIEYLFILKRRKEQQCCNVKQYSSYLSRFKSYRIILLYYLFHLICFFEIFYPRLTKKSKLILYYHYIKFHFYKPLLKTKEIEKLHFHHMRYLNLISIPFFFISYKII